MQDLLRWMLIKFNLRGSWKEEIFRFHSYLQKFKEFHLENHKIITICFLSFLRLSIQRLMLILKLIVL